MLVVALLLAACSYMGSLVVSNRSEQTIRIGYQFKKWRSKGADSLECIALEKIDAVPAVVPVAKVSPWIGPPSWEKLQSQSYTYDRTSCRLVVELGPKTSLRISHLQHALQGKTIEDLREIDEWEFLIPVIAIETSRGSIQYQGEEFVKQFRKRSLELFELEYR